MLAGVGSIATGIGQTFMKDDWAVRIKNSVATLVGIGDLDFGKALKATNLGTIGLGLAAFGLLSGVGALGQALADSFNKEGWAQNIVANVATLVSIDDALSFLKALEAAGTLKTIGAGLAVFGVGAGVAKFATLVLQMI